MKQVFSDTGQQAEQDSDPWERLKKKKKKVRPMTVSAYYLEASCRVENRREETHARICEGEYGKEGRSTERSSGDL